jgi:hypothetical protein
VAFPSFLEAHFQPVLNRSVPITVSLDGTFIRLVSFSVATRWTADWKRPLRNDSFPHRIENDLRHAVQIQFLQNVRAVCVHGV